MQWHKLNQTTCKKKQPLRNTRKETKEEAWLWLKASPKLVETLDEGRKRSLMIYDFTKPTEDSSMKTEDSGEPALSQSAHANMSARATRNPILVLCGKP